jgi:hypothetical protein
MYKKTNADKWALYPPDATPATPNTEEAPISQEHGVGTVYEYKVAVYCGSLTYGPWSSPPVSFPGKVDVVILLARSSRWMPQYAQAAEALVGSIKEKLPKDSRVAVLAFQDKVYNNQESLLDVQSDASNNNVRDTLRWVNGVNGKPMDWWKLDIGEVLSGQNGDVGWRDSVLSPNGGSKSAKELLATGTNSHQIAILITDWYDGYVQGGVQGYEVRQKWAEYLRDFKGDLVNVILVPSAGTTGTTFASGAEYMDFLFNPTSGNSPEVAVNQAAKSAFENAIGPDDIKVVGYDKIYQLATAVTGGVSGVRENLVNEVYQVNPGEKRRFELAVDASVRDVGLLLFGAGLTHRLYRPDGTEVPLEWVDGVIRSSDPSVRFDRFEDGNTYRFDLQAPIAGQWVVEADGAGLSSAVWGRAVAFGTSTTKLVTRLPEVVRPGEPFEAKARVSGGELSGGKSGVSLRLIRPGNVYALGSRVSETALEWSKKAWQKVSETGGLR